MPRGTNLLPVLVLTGLLGCTKERPAAARDPATWTVSSVSGLLQPGSTDTVRFAATLDSGWYVYALTQKEGGPTPMTVAIEPSPPFTLVGEISAPEPVKVYDKEFKITTERYLGAPKFAAVVAIAPGASRPPSLNLKVRYQACNATLCLPAHTTTLTTPVRVATPQ